MQDLHELESTLRVVHRAPPRTEPPTGLFRSIVAAPSRRMSDVFAALPQHHGSKILVRRPGQRTYAARLELDREEGHGAWEFYRLGPSLYVVAGDFVYDRTRIDRAPGEDLLEFHLRLSGTLNLGLPGEVPPLVVAPDSLLLLRQPDGVDVVDRVEAGVRDAFVSVFCSTAHFASLAERYGLAVPAALAFMAGGGVADVQHRLMPMNAGLLHVAHSLLRSPYEGGLRLMHAEAKVTELLCEVLHLAAQAPAPARVGCHDDLRRLDLARRIIMTQHSPPPQIADIARRVGMSETKLKRAFKARFGTTLFDMSLDARMRHALELLRCKHMAVGQVAYAVGYSHQTSFASAFKRHFGFLPRAARQESG